MWKILVKIFAGISKAQLFYRPVSRSMGRSFGRISESMPDRFHGEFREKPYEEFCPGNSAKIAAEICRRLTEDTPENIPRQML